MIESFACFRQFVFQMLAFKKIFFKLQYWFVDLLDLI